MNVRVAIVDSGVNAVHSHVGRVTDGVAIALTEKGDLAFHADFRDHIGHGTAVAGVVRMLAPEAELLAVKIVADDGRSSAVQLVAGIDWAVEQGVHILNLSLGTANPGDAEMVKDACQRALAKGVLVVASAPSRVGPPMWPSCLPEVIGVKADSHLGPLDVRYAPPHAPAWRALGEPRPLPGQNQGRNFKGSSFATARVSGFLAQEAVQAGLWDGKTCLSRLQARALAQSNRPT